MISIDAVKKSTRVYKRSPQSFACALSSIELPTSLEEGGEAKN